MSTIGSFFPQQTPTSHVLSASVLTDEGIMAKHNITSDELLRIGKELRNMKLLNILFFLPGWPAL